MGKGYTGNHPRLTMIHDRELIYDAKQQLHRADKVLHAYDKAAAKQTGTGGVMGLTREQYEKAAAASNKKRQSQGLAPVNIPYESRGQKNVAKEAVNIAASQGINKDAPNYPGKENQTLMAYSSEADNAAAMMLPGKIHPLSDVYGKVRNLEQYMPVDNRAAAKAIIDTSKLGPQGKMVEGIARKKGLLKKGCSYK